MSINNQTLKESQLAEVHKYLNADLRDLCLDTPEEYGQDLYDIIHGKSAPPTEWQPKTIKPIHETDITPISIPHQLAPPSTSRPVSVLKADYEYIDRINKKYAGEEQLRLDPHPKAIGLSSSAVLNAAMATVENIAEELEGANPLISSNAATPTSLAKQTILPPAAPAQPSKQKEENFFFDCFSGLFSFFKFFAQIFKA